MSVTKQYQSAGTFTVNLLDSTPRTITDRFKIGTDAFGLVAILPGRVGTDWLSASDLLGLSIFTGLYRRQETVNGRYLALEGDHVTTLLGDQDGKGPLAENGGGHPGGGGSGPASFSSWVSFVTPPTVNVGTTGSIGGSLTWAWDWTNDAATPRDALNYLCSYFGAVWRLNDDLTLDVDTVTNLGWLDFNVLATPWWQGRDPNILAIRADIEATGDVESYANRVLNTADAGIGEPGGGGTSGTPFTNPATGGVLAWKERISTDSSTDSGDATQQTLAELERINAPAVMPTLVTDRAAIMLDLEPGEFLCTFAPDADILGSIFLGIWPSETYYRGLLVPWEALSVQSIEMPIEPGMGVYFIDHNQDVVDLTPWVAYESPGATIEVGAVRPTLGAAVVQRGGVKNN